MVLSQDSKDLVRLGKTSLEIFLGLGRQKLGVGNRQPRTSLALSRAISAQMNQLLTIRKIAAKLLEIAYFFK
jgi:hypothetical protein